MGWGKKFKKISKGVVKPIKKINKGVIKPSTKVINKGVVKPIKKGLKKVSISANDNKIIDNTEERGKK